MDHALALYTIHANKRRAFDHQREVAFARRIVTAVAAMLLAIVDKLDP